MSQERVFKAEQFDLPVIATLSHQVVTGLMGFVLHQLTDARRPQRRVVGPFDLEPMRSKRIL
jgi:hypothetical protein